VTAADTSNPVTKNSSPSICFILLRKKIKITFYRTCSGKMDLWVTRPRFELCTFTLQIQVLRLRALSGYNRIEYVGLLGWTQVLYCWTATRSVVTANINRMVHTEFAGMHIVYFIMKFQISALRLLLATDGSRYRYIIQPIYYFFYKENKYFQEFMAPWVIITGCGLDDWIY
jgi:hypothetical protein